MLTCLEVTHLVLAGEDRALQTDERRDVREHWRVCPGCRDFMRHVKLMRTALGRWRQGRDGLGDLHVTTN